MSGAADRRESRGRTGRINVRHDFRERAGAFLAGVASGSTSDRVVTSKGRPENLIRRGADRDRVANIALQGQVHLIAIVGSRGGHPSRSKTIATTTVRRSIQIEVIREIQADFGVQGTRKVADSLESSSGRGKTGAIVPCRTGQIRIIRVLTANARLVVRRSAITVSIERD